MIGIKLNTKKFAFACTCSCGNRTTPCVHSLVFITMFSQRLTVIEDNRFENNSSEDEVLTLSFKNCGIFILHFEVPYNQKQL